MDRETIQERFGIVGRSAAIRHVIDQVRLVARTDANVLIHGESGVGKEVIARTIHQLSGRKHNRMVVVNCGAIPEGLIESELFGAEKGAYTGATDRRAGYFEEADKGTIFLDEIGEMPLQAQVRLLRVLESGEFSRVGSSVTLKSDARVVAATNKNLSVEVRNARFREDLYYRLATVVIEIPPLRQRKEDILPLFEQFLFELSQEYNNAGLRLESGARDLLLQYRWPGNVRELRNVAERVVVLHRGESISDADIRPYLRGVTASSGGGELMPISSDSTAEPTSSRERELIYRALLELRMEIRELKQQMMRGQQMAPPRPAPDETEYYYYDDVDAPESVIEDAPYEIADDLNGNGNHSGSGAGGGHGNGAGRGAHTGVDDGDQYPRRETPSLPPGPTQEEPLPTLEDAERELIVEALRRFDGNRRQTARALGISERTLYRKIREIEDEEDAEERSASVGPDAD